MMTRRNACRMLLAALTTGAVAATVTAEFRDRANRGGLARRRYGAAGGAWNSYKVDENGDMKFNANAFGQRRGYRASGARGYGGRGNAGHFRSGGQY
jgi:hypothetical protein